MESKEEALVGYWNKSKTDPKITFTQPEDLNNYQLCIIRLTPIKEEVETPIVKKVNKELRNLVESVRRLK